MEHGDINFLAELMAGLPSHGSCMQRWLAEKVLDSDADKMHCW